MNSATVCYLKELSKCRKDSQSRPVPNTVLPVYQLPPTTFVLQPGPHLKKRGEIQLPLFAMAFEGLDTLCDVMRYWSVTTPETPMLVFRSLDGQSRHVVSYKDLYDLGGRWAEVLRHKGLGRGQFIVNALPNSPERAVAEAGILLSGAASVYGDHWLKDGSDLVSILQRSGARALIVDPACWAPEAWSTLLGHVGQAREGGSVACQALPELRFVLIVRLSAPQGGREASASESCFEGGGGGGGGRAPGRNAGNDPVSDVGKTDGESAARDKNRSADDLTTGGPADGTGSDCINNVADETDPSSSEVESAAGKPSLASPGDGDNFLPWLTKLREKPGSHFHAANVTERDACAVLMTSGSTGEPKLVVHTHGGFLRLGKRMKMTARVEFNNSLMGWSSGYIANMLLSGSTRVLHDGREEPRARALRQEEAMAEFFVNSVLQEEIQHASIPLPYYPAVLSRLRDAGHQGPLLGSVVMGTQPITKTIVDMGLKLARQVLVFYASTELLFVSSAVVSDPSQIPEDFYAGKPTPWIEVKILSEDGGGGRGGGGGDTEASAGTPGEVAVKSPFGFSRYLNAPELTSSLFTLNGFFRTGDRGWFDADGNLYVQGRTKHTVNQGSAVIHPGQIESRMRRYPGVQNVMVVAVPDPLYFNALCACVVLEDPEMTSDDVRSMVEDDFQQDDTRRPRMYLTFDSFPLTRTEKESREELRKVALRRLGKQ